MRNYIVRGVCFAILLCFAATSLLSCSRGEPILPSEEQTIVRIGVIGEGSSGICYCSDQASSDGLVHLSDGSAFPVGSLKPVWKEISDRLGVRFEDVSCGVDEGGDLSECDIVIGKVDQLDRLARRGLLLDLSDHYSEIPSVKSYLFSDDLVFMYLGESIYNEAGIYSVPAMLDEPRFDLVPFVLDDVVRTLLDEDFVGSGRSIAPISVTPYLPEEGSVTVDILTEDGEVGHITKNYTVSGNIISLMRIYGNDLTGDEAVKLLRSYIDQAYGGYYGDTRSGLFLGVDSAYDADELAALLICVVANAEHLCESGDLCALGVSDINEAIAVLASIYGVRGLGLGGFRYVDANGELRDARTEAESYWLLDRLNDWLRDGLIVFDDRSAAASVAPDGPDDDGGYYRADSKKENAPKALIRFSDEAPSDEYSMMLPPVARWYDGSNKVGGIDVGQYTRFVENVSYADDIAVGISKKGVTTSNKRLSAALALLELAFTESGKEILSLNNIISDRSALAEQAYSLGYEDIIEYLEDFYGAGICFSIPWAEWAGVAASDKAVLRLAEEKGLLKRIGTNRAEPENWYVAAPKLLPFTNSEYERLRSLIEFSNDATEYIFGYASLSAQIINNGLRASGYESAEAVIAYISSAWRTNEYNKILTDAYLRLRIYYYEYLKGVEY